MEIMSMESLPNNQFKSPPMVIASTEGEERSRVPSPSNNPGSIDQSYLQGLLRERELLGVGSGLDLTRRLVNQEIERIQNGGKIIRNEDRKMNDVTKDKAIKLTVKILVPAKDHPKFNFVGKLLGPKGNSLKRLQEETMTKMAILGRGSMRDKQKEEELRLSGDQKFNHLSEDLHVEVAALAPPAEAHARIAYALTEIRRYLVPDYNDDIRKEQMREMQLLNNSTTSTSNSSMVSNTESSTNNGTMNNISDEGSCSPHTNEGDCLHQSPPHTEDRVKSISSSSSTSPSKGTNPSSSSSVTGSNMNTSHPVFPVLTRSHTSISSANKDPSNSSRARVKAQSRRSVLSLLTKAKAIQQKEHEYMGVFHDMASYNVYEHLGEIPINDGSSEELLGRSGGAIKVTTSPTDRARFRHDPYPRIASST